MLTTIHPQDAINVVYSIHRKPFHVLGMHPVKVKYRGQEKDVLSVRAFLPDAKKVWVIDKKNSTKKWEMERVHQDGLFEVIIWERKVKFPYKYEVLGYFGNYWEMEDPYEEWVEEITPFDRYLFNRSMHYKLYEKMGAHVKTVNGKKGVYFSVWAPNAQRVSVIGDFNNWDGRRDPMEFMEDSGVWVLFKPGLTEGDLYKYEIKGYNGEILVKSDPYAFFSEKRPQTASIVYELKDYSWNDSAWLDKRATGELLDRPISIYEVHAGSWMRVVEDENRFLTYRELADKLIPYVKEMGFTHIEFLPLEEHPLDASWGYQVTGYFAPTSRFGTPEDLQYFIDRCHQENIGVILDWVPAHFPKDAHGLIKFDGTALYEHEDPRKGEHPDWGTKIFNYGRAEVKNFLISNALYWIDKFHFDGLRVDAVASMLYLDYSKKDGEWVPNQYGGRENLEAIDFLKHLNSIIYQYFPGVLMIAEESTAWPNVSRPVYSGGLGFAYKWNMGWMHDILNYMSKDPIHRKYHHHNLTFGLLYAWSENFILPFSHDEVVHGKGSLLNKMPGDWWQKFANLRVLYTFMWGHPGKKMLFMGQEFAQSSEWSEEKSLDWHLLNYPEHQGIKKCIQDLNHLYHREKALWENDFSSEGFEWINCDDSDNSVISFIRYDKKREEFLIFVLNFTPIVRYDYTIGVPEAGFYTEIFNSDAGIYGGSNVGNNGGVHTLDYGAFSRPYALRLTVPPLGGVILKLAKG
jgi:1,4-alpha-glucan branching enzyme